MLWLTYQINLIGDDMNKKNLMIGLTLLLISVIGIIVPTMISNQSGAQPSRSQDGEALLLSNQHIRSRRGYRFKYAGQFSFNTDDNKEELDEFEDEEELDELESEAADEIIVSEVIDTGYVASEPEQIGSTVNKGRDETTESNQPVESKEPEGPKPGPKPKPEPNPNPKPKPTPTPTPEPEPEPEPTPPKPDITPDPIPVPDPVPDLPEEGGEESEQE